MEVEAHHVEAHDTFGKMIGIQTAVLAVLLSVFTIIAHRAHTDTILLSNESSNTWAHYQAKRIRAFQLEMNVGLVKLLAPTSTESTKMLESYATQGEKYTKELEEVKAEGDKTKAEEETTHHKAGYFDLAEGLLEISMILSSLYFISQKKLFPSLGLLMGVSGVIVGILGLLAH